MSSIRPALGTNRCEWRYRDLLDGQRKKICDTKAFLAKEEASIARGAYRDSGGSRAKFAMLTGVWLSYNSALATVAKSIRRVPLSLVLRLSRIIAVTDSLRTVL